MSNFDYRQAYFRKKETIKMRTSPTCQLERRGSFRLLDRYNSFRLSCRNLMGCKSREDIDPQDSFSSLDWSNDSPSSVGISQSRSLNDILSLSQSADRLASRIHDRIETMRSTKQEVNYRIEKRVKLALARYEGGGRTSALVSMRKVQKLGDDLARIIFVESQLVGIYKEIELLLDNERMLVFDTMTATDLEHLRQASERVEENVTATRFAPSKINDEELLEDLEEIMKRDLVFKER